MIYMMMIQFLLYYSKNQKPFHNFFYYCLFYNLILFKNWSWRTTCVISSTISPNWLLFAKSDRLLVKKEKKKKKIYSLSLLNRINTIVKLNVNSMSMKTSEMFISGPNCCCWARIKPPRGTRFNSLKLFVFSKRKGSRMFIQTSLIPFIRPRMQAFSMVTQFSNFMKSYIYAFLHKTDKNPTWVLIFALLIFRD